MRQDLKTPFYEWKPHQELGNSVCFQSSVDQMDDSTGEELRFQFLGALRRLRLLRLKVRWIRCLGLASRPAYASRH